MKTGLTLFKIIERMKYLYGDNHFDSLEDTWNYAFLKTWKEMYAKYNENPSEFDEIYENNEN
jgi:uncharacterized protein YozE (UPF0346 family)